MRVCEVRVSTHDNVPVTGVRADVFYRFIFKSAVVSP